MTVVFDDPENPTKLNAGCAIFITMNTKYAL